MIDDWVDAHRGWKTISEDQLYLVMHIQRVRVAAQGTGEV